MSSRVAMRTLLVSLLFITAPLQWSVRGEELRTDVEPKGPDTKDPNWLKNLQKKYGNKVVNSQIVGGTVTTRGTYPWTTFLVSDNVWGMGSLIHAQWVLTNGFVLGTRTNITVTLGMQTNNIYFEDGRVVLETNTKFVHASYGNNYAGDFNIALVKLPIAVPSTSYIKPVLLPKLSQAATTFAGTAATAIGWGRTTGTVAVTSPDLRVITPITVLTNAACVSSWGATSITDYKICVDTTGGKSPCHSDYGGALVYQESAGVWVQIGIFSWPENTCTIGVPAVYLRTSKHLSWISSTAGITLRP